MFSEAAQAGISTQSSRICQTTPAEKTHYLCRVASSSSVIFSLLYLGLPCLRVRWQSAFSVYKFSQNCLEFLFIYLLHFPSLHLCCKAEPLMVFNPDMSPVQMTLLAWCQEKTNREQQYAFDKRWIPSERREGIWKRDEKRTSAFEVPV